MSATTLRHPIDWAKLPPLELQDDCTELMILAVGAMISTEGQARGAGVADALVLDGPHGSRAVLGTATVQRGDEVTLHRLPRFLAEWALDAMAAAKAGFKPYPCRVRFHRQPEGVEISYPDRR